jgi:hypothetical protein
MVPEWVWLKIERRCMLLRVIAQAAFLQATLQESAKGKARQAELASLPLLGREG